MPTNSNSGDGRPAGVGATGKSVSFRGQSPMAPTNDKAPMPRGGTHGSPPAPGGKNLTPPGG